MTAGGRDRAESYVADERPRREPQIALFTSAVFYFSVVLAALHIPTIVASVELACWRIVRH
eukprot:6061567-Pyramimonas_sp.AAC.1